MLQVNTEDDVILGRCSCDSTEKRDWAVQVSSTFNFMKLMQNVLCSPLFLHSLSTLQRQNHTLPIAIKGLFPWWSTVVSNAWGRKKAISITSTKLAVNFFTMLDVNAYSLFTDYHTSCHGTWLWIKILSLMSYIFTRFLRQV